MRMNVLTELRQSVGSVTTLDIEDESLRADGLEITGLNGRVVLMRTDKGLLVSLRSAGIATEACSRCLKETPCDIAVTFEEEYVPVLDPLTGAKVRIGFEPDAFRISQDFTLDLREGIRQYLLISEPTKPLCRQDCAGLCSTCGADLNAELCSCAGASDPCRRALAGVITE